MSSIKGNPKKVLLFVGIGAVLLVVGAILITGLYSGSEEAKTSLIARYFRAVESGDELAVGDMTVPGFRSELNPGPLKRGNYELYDLGQQSEAVSRVLLIAPGVDGKKQAFVGEIHYKRRGLSTRIESLRLLMSGSRIKD